MAPPRLPDKAAPIRAAGSAHAARRAPQLFLENKPLPQARITDIKLQDQVATAADTRGKRQIMLAVADLLMGNLETLPVLKDRLQRENRHNVEVATDESGRGMGRHNKKGKMSTLHGNLLCNRARAQAGSPTRHTVDRKG
jgi:hypothetical protein